MHPLIFCISSFDFLFSPFHSLSSSILFSFFSACSLSFFPVLMTLLHLFSIYFPHSLIFPSFLPSFHSITPAYPSKSTAVPYFLLHKILVAILGASYFRVVVCYPYPLESLCATTLYINHSKLLLGFCAQLSTCQ